MPVLESRVWGGHSELVAVNMLVATISEGGMAIGAFDGDRLVGSVYGFATNQPHVLHSHYLAVDPDYRRSGLGVALKYEQRDWCLANERTAMRWTFDPLQLGNACVQSGHRKLISQVIGNVDVGRHPSQVIAAVITLVDVQSASGDHRCCCRGPLASRGRPRLQRVQGLGQQACRSL